MQEEHATRPEGLPVAQSRIARPTADLDATVRFYRDDLGLTRLAEFRDHDGYDGVVLGLPGTTTQLEITSQSDEPPDNPYWHRRGCAAFRDPDGWLVILAPFVFG